MNNRIVIPRLSDLEALEVTVPGRVIRDAPTEADILYDWPGALTVFDTSLLNYGRLETSGVDLDLSYELRSPLGSMEGALSATWVDEYSSSEMSSTVPLDRVGVANVQGTIPRWRLVGSLTWEGDRWGTSATVTYIPRYQDSVPTSIPDRTLPSRTLVDVQGWLELQEPPSSALLANIKLTAGVLNLFDRDADFANAGLILGYDTSQSEMKQRFAYLRITKDF